VNISDIQLNPYSQYKIIINTSRITRISRTFHAEMPEYKCDLLPVVGTCSGRTTGYYYNLTSKTCEEFIYSGCGGTKPFDSFEECNNSCYNISLF